MQRLQGIQLPPQLAPHKVSHITLLECEIASLHAQCQQSGGGQGSQGTPQAAEQEDDIE